MKRLLGLAMAVMVLCGATAFAADTKAKLPAGKAEANLTIRKESVEKQHRHRHHRRHHRHHHKRRMVKK